MLRVDLWMRDHIPLSCMGLLIESRLLELGVWLHDNMNWPWICMGYLNELMSPMRRRGAPWCNTRTRYLGSFVDYNNLFDVEFKGRRFTWVKKLGDIVVIQERLDRCLMNEKWMDLSPDLRAIHCPRIGLDHNPILLDSLPPYSKGHKQFMFEAS